MMWTDTFQGAVMFGSFLAVIIKGIFDACGAKVVWDRNYQSGRIELFKYLAIFHYIITFLKKLSTKKEFITTYMVSISSFDTDLTTRHTVWTMIVGGYFTWISVYGINQTQVQRYLTVNQKSKAVK